MSDLQIPAEAKAIAHAFGVSPQILADTAPFIVAAAYRDAADELEQGAFAANASSPATVAVADGVHVAIVLLRYRADQLDGGEPS